MLPWPDKAGLSAANLPVGCAKIRARTSFSWEIVPCLAASPKMLEYGGDSGSLGVHFLRRGKLWNWGGINAVPEVSVVFQTASGKTCLPQRVCEPRTLGAASPDSRYLNNRRAGCLLKRRSGINSLAGPGAVTSNNGCSSSYKFIFPQRATAWQGGKPLPHAPAGIGNTLPSQQLCGHLAKCPLWDCHLEPRAGKWGFDKP